MGVTLSCECGATIQVVAREDPPRGAICRACGRPIAVPTVESADGEEKSAGFALLREPPPVPIAPEPEPQTVEELLRQIDGPMLNMLRSVQMLEGTMTTEEHTRILEMLEEAKKARDSALEPAVAGLQAVLRRLKEAAGLIGQAMLRQ